MKSFQLKSVMQNINKRKIYILDEKDNKIADIFKVSYPGKEKGSSFVLRKNREEIYLGTEKGRLLFATYHVDFNGKTWILKDNMIRSTVYFCVDGELHDKKIRFEENWKKEVDVKLDGEKVAIIKPHLYSLEATISMKTEESRDPLLFAVTCLMYFMFKIYQDEVEVIESILDEWI